MEVKQIRVLPHNRRGQQTAQDCYFRTSPSSSMVSAVGVRTCADTKGTRHKVLVFLTFSAALLISACTGFPQSKTDIEVPATSPSTTSARNYRCESGEIITATYFFSDSAVIRYKGRAYDMLVAVSGSGARYVAGDLEWWTKGSGPGSEGALFRHLANGTSGEIIELCTEF